MAGSRHFPVVREPSCRDDLHSVVGRRSIEVDMSVTVLTGHLAAARQDDLVHLTPDGQNAIVREVVDPGTAGAAGATPPQLRCRNVLNTHMLYQISIDDTLEKYIVTYLTYAFNATKQRRIT